MWGAAMSGSEFEFESNDASTDVAGTPEGDGDFETDSLPATGATSAGGQLNTGQAEAGSKDVPPHKPTGLELILDEISSGKIMP